jgi:hypothetical protein
MPVIGDVFFEVTEAILAVSMLAWVILYFKEYPFTRLVAFRVIPFLLVLILFAVAFYSEQGPAG